MPISQNGFSVCFVIQSLEKNEVQMVHELKYALSVFCFVIQHINVIFEDLLTLFINSK